MVIEKAASAGISITVAISAPTELAIHQAEAAGVTLLAPARSDGFTIYAHHQRYRDCVGSSASIELSEKTAGIAV
jgi:formate dehydrogenase accessory protein FdhD